MIKLTLYFYMIEKNRHVPIDETFLDTYTSDLHHAFPWTKDIPTQHFVKFSMIADEVDPIQQELFFFPPK